VTNASNEDDWAPLPQETVLTPEAKAAARDAARQVAMPQSAVRAHKPATAVPSHPEVGEDALADAALTALRERLY